MKRFEDHSQWNFLMKQSLFYGNSLFRLRCVSSPLCLAVVTELPVYLARVFLFSAMLHRSRYHRKWNSPVARACKSVFASTRPTLFAAASLWFAFYGSFLAILSVYKLTRLLNSMGNNYSANESSYLRSFIKKHCKGKCLFYRFEN